MSRAEEKVYVRFVSVPDVLEEVSDIVNVFPTGTINRALYWRRSPFQICEDDPSVVYHDVWPQEEVD